jgi:hypothetical protein
MNGETGLCLAADYAHTLVADFPELSLPVQLRPDRPVLVDLPRVTPLDSDNQCIST